VFNVFVVKHLFAFVATIVVIGLSCDAAPIENSSRHLKELMPSWKNLTLVSCFLCFRRQAIALLVRRGGRPSHVRARIAWISPGDRAED
jgi:hypothetical protein